jgi:hypothetical protein
MGLRPPPLSTYRLTYRRARPCFGTPAGKLRLEKTSMFKALFVEHPRAVNESYGEHWIVANSFGLKMIVAGLGTMLHGFVPGLLTHAGSDAIRKLHGEMTRRQAAAINAQHDRPAPKRWQPEYEI